MLVQIVLLTVDTRKHYFHANTTKDLFENVHMDNVLSFLKETWLYQEI